jgi:hypothetical protein
MPVITEDTKALVEKHKVQFLESQWEYAYMSIQDKLGKEKVRKYL